MPTALAEPQPAKAVLALRRLTNRHVAIQLGISEVEFGRILNGYVSPTPPLRQKLSALLAVPERDLFRDGQTSDDHAR